MIFIYKYTIEKITISEKTKCVKIIGCKISGK